MDDITIYDYTFAVWVKPNHKFSTSLVTWLRMTSLCIMEMTEDQFAQFRWDMLQDGFDLHEITRAPHHEPELVL